MPVIYFDNFRGFEKTYLPLKQINFLVGENSTGKTSVLKLIRVISSPRFWINHEFSNEETKLGHFNEIVSYFSKKRTFEVGILGDQFDKENGISATKLVFTNKDG